MSHVRELAPQTWNSTRELLRDQLDHAPWAGGSRRIGSKSSQTLVSQLDKRLVRLRGELRVQVWKQLELACQVQLTRIT